MSEVAQTTNRGFDYDEYLRRYSRSKKTPVADSVADDAEIRAMADKTIDIFANAMAKLSSHRCKSDRPD